MVPSSLQICTPPLRRAPASSALHPLPRNGSPSKATNASVFHLTSVYPETHSSSARHSVPSPALVKLTPAYHRPSVWPDGSRTDIYSGEWWTVINCCPSDVIASKSVCWATSVNACRASLKPGWRGRAKLTIFAIVHRHYATTTTNQQIMRSGALATLVSVASSHYSQKSPTSVSEHHRQRTNR